MANIPTNEEMEKMFEELKAVILESQEKLKPTPTLSVGWQDTNKICEDTGIDRSTLFLYKEREWLRPDEDYFQLGRKYYWRVESIRALLSGKKDVSKKSGD